MSAGARLKSRAGTGHQRARRRNADAEFESKLRHWLAAADPSERPPYGLNRRTGLLPISPG